jgi:DNA-binding SARP family transcriptional activator
LAVFFFRILGHVDLWEQERSHSVGPRKEQCILAALLWESGRVVSAQTLAERVWDERMPDRARETLQVYISRLRHRLRLAGDRDGLIASSAAGGYRLNVEADQVDARRFNQLIASARAASAERDPHRARELLLRAEALWRGEPLEGLSGQWVETARGTLLERRRGALLARIGLDLQIGADREDAISELTEFAHADRIDQGAVELLMGALARAGRQDEALAAYRAARLRLREELGVDPRRELVALHQSILRGETPAEQPAARPAHRGALAPHTLDRDPPYLIGRDEDVHRLVAAAAEDLAAPTGIALLALDGMPGIGKTAVALRTAHELAPQCPDGVLQISFRTHDPSQAPLDPRTALVLLLEALGTASTELGQAASHDELAGLWRRRTRGLRLLVLFDDVHDTDQISPLMPVSPGSVILVTSRRRPHLPGARHLTLGALSDLAAVRLLARVTGRRFTRQSRDLQRFVARCGGLPLAVTVSAAHLRAHPAWTLSDLVDRLESPTQAAGDDRLSAPVHRAFELSYQTLPPTHRRLLRLVASQPTPDLGLHAAAALLDADARSVDLLLEALVEQHLLDEVSRHRYRLHDLLRAFATHRAQEEDGAAEISASVDRMIALYLSAAAQAERTVRPNRRIACRIPDSPYPTELGLGRSAAAHAWLDTESANLLAIAAYTDSTAPGRHAGVMACIVAQYLDRRGLWLQAVEVLTRALRAATAGCEETAFPNLAQLHIHLAAAHVRIRRLEDAAVYATAALEAWRAQHDVRGQADALLELGRIHWYAQRLDEANAAYEASEVLYRDLRQPHGCVLADYHRAIILFQQNRHTEAIDVERRALETVSGITDSALECDVLINLAEMYRWTAQDDLARASLDRAARLAGEHRDPQHLAGLALNTGILEHRGGDDEAAAKTLRTALDLFQSLGDPAGQIDALTALAAVHRAEANPEIPRGYIRQAEQLLTRVGDPQRSSRLEVERGELLLRERQASAACAHLQAAVTLAREAGAPLEEANARRALAIAMLGLHDKVGARRQEREALALYRLLAHRDAEVLAAQLSDCA